MRVYKTYTIAEKKKLLMNFDQTTTSSKSYAEANDIPWATWRGWLAKKKTIIMTTRNGKQTSLGGQGRNQIIPFADDLHEYMLQVRSNEHFLTHTHMMTFMKMHHMDCLHQLGTTLSEILVPLSLLTTRPLSHQDDSSRSVSYTRSLCNLFLGKFRATAPRDIINVDETSIYYDMPPGKTLAEIGGSSKVDKSQKHSDRISDKLPILFIVRGAPGGPIDTDELPTYPSGHMYVVQESAWMDKHVWAHYLNELLKFEIVGSSVILCDNLDCHVSEESCQYRVVRIIQCSRTSPEEFDQRMPAIGCWCDGAAEEQAPIEMAS
ncbi:hypothetical protein AeRB84_006337 [Aphanomyces euteiches]|nr:hypothetical protein AeRB84_006337 [Aphanomyces euteiches]